MELVAPVPLAIRDIYSLQEVEMMLQVMCFRFDWGYILLDIAFPHYSSAKSKCTYMILLDLVVKGTKFLSR